LKFAATRSPFSEAVCPHKGGPLADGLLGQRTVVCPLHACGFDVVSGMPAGHAYGGLKVYPIHLDSKEDLIITFGIREEEE